MKRPVNVLVVEDLPTTLALIRQALKAADDVAVEEARTLAEAVERLKSAAADVVLLDLGLPDAAGVEAVERLQKEAPQIPIVVLSGEGSLYRDALHAGAQEFLTKPADGPTIARALRNAVARHEVRPTFSPMERLGETIREMRDNLPPAGDEEGRP